MQLIAAVPNTRPLPASCLDPVLLAVSPGHYIGTLYSFFFLWKGMLEPETAWAVKTQTSACQHVLLSNRKYFLLMSKSGLKMTFPFKQGTCRLFQRYIETLWFWHLIQIPLDDTKTRLLCYGHLYKWDSIHSIHEHTHTKCYLKQDLQGILKHFCRLFSVNSIQPVFTVQYCAWSCN